MIKEKKGGDIQGVGEWGRPQGCGLNTKAGMFQSHRLVFPKSNEYVVGVGQCTDAELAQ